MERGKPPGPPSFFHGLTKQIQFGLISMILTLLFNRCALNDLTKLMGHFHHLLSHNALRFLQLQR